MLRDIFTNKFILGGFALLIIVAGACYVWYHYDLLPYKQEAVKSSEYARYLENIQKAKAKAGNRASVETEQTEKGTTSPIAKPIHETPQSPETDEHSEKQAPVTSTAQVDNADERVSPHGFGPFPKLPEGYPGSEDPNFWTYDWEEDGELAHRVFIKLWEQGSQVIGGTRSNGLIYPNYPNTLIVKWKTQQTPFGTRRYASRWQGSPETESFLRSHTGPLYESNIPSDIKVLEFKDAGIDPYEFLNLPK